MAVPAERRSEDRSARLWWAGLQALAGAVVATLAVRSLAIATLDIPPEFPPLAGPGPTIFFTALGVLAAVVVFAVVRRLAARPIRVFRMVAAVSLLLSFLPDLWLLGDVAATRFPGASGEAVGVLMAQHVAAAAVVVWALTTRGPSGASR